MPKVTIPEPAMFMGDAAANGEADQDYFTLDQMEVYAAAKLREALELAAATVVKGINERSSLIANVTRRNAASEILNLIQ